MTTIRTRVLVVANQTCPCPELRDRLVDLQPEAVHLIAPALLSRLEHWTSDTDGAAEAATARLEAAVTAMRGSGLEVTGEVGDAKPIIAIEDALAIFEATELLISTWPPERSHWLERGLLDDVRRFGLPVTHLTSPYGLPRTADAHVAG